MQVIDNASGGVGEGMQAEQGDRCTGISGASLSLSLSLCSQSFSAENGAQNDDLAGWRRASERGFCRSSAKAGPQLRPEGLDLLPAEESRLPSRLRDSISWPAGRTSGSCAAPTRAGSVGPERRGLSHAWPRRPLFSSRPSRAEVCSSVVGPTPSGLWRSRRPRRVLPHAPVVVSAERRGSTDPGSRRSPIYVSRLGGGC
jgi:hypothetical protein